MIRKKFVEGIVKYFISEHWQKVMRALEDPEVIHMHVYVGTRIHWTSLQEILKGYFKMKGMPLTRNIDVVGGDGLQGPGFISLHGVAPSKCRAHFGFLSRFDSDVILEPTESELYKEDFSIFRDHGEEESLKKTLEKFRFRDVGPKEEAEIGKYFKSKHWEKAYNMAKDRTIQHFHVHVETSIHPDILNKFAVNALKAQGYKIQETRQSMFKGLGGIDYPKIMFLLSEPECMFDMTIVLNPDVILRPNRTVNVSGIKGEPEYFVVDTETRNRYYEEAKKKPYITLTEDEVNEVLEGISNE